MKTGNPDEAYKISPGDLRDILIIAGIFLFFTGWVYIYFFYDYFGISLSQVNIDYSTFVVYSFVVLTSTYSLPLFVLIALIFVYLKWLKKYVTLAVILALLLFPALYALAKSVANRQAISVRSSPNSMRHISFVFRDDAGFLAYPFNNDSLPGKNLLVRTDLTILKGTTIPSQLYLLGQNSDYYFVLYQPSKVPEIKGLPFGNIYFISRKDVLYAKIGVTSNEKK